jgi:hypothetical protein
MMGARFESFFPEKNDESFSYIFLTRSITVRPFVLRYAKERTKNQMITGEDDLTDRSTELWEAISGDLLESVFCEWVSRLELVIEQARECYISP